MRHTKIKKPISSTWKIKWEKWQENCKKSQEELDESHDCGLPIKITDRYKDLALYYVDLDGPFFGKCAYCESPVAVNQTGDIEHFRPKGAVSDNGKFVSIKDKAGNTIPHPGYYWLTYRFENLLLSCYLCNRRTSKFTPNPIGKGTEFPVVKFRATRSGEERKERPLLLNPLKCKNFDKHFTFRGDGFVECHTPQALKSAEMFGLNARPPLIAARIAEFNRGRDLAHTLASAWGNRSEQRIIEVCTEIDKIASGRAPFSAAARAGFNAAMDDCNINLLALLKKL